MDISTDLVVGAKDNIFAGDHITAHLHTGIGAHRAAAVNAAGNDGVLAEADSAAEDDVAHIVAARSPAIGAATREDDGVVTISQAAVLPDNDGTVAPDGSMDG